MAFRPAAVVTVGLAACTLSAALVSTGGGHDSRELSDLRIMTKAEIMENMTMDAAVNTFMRIGVIKREYPALVEIVKNQFNEREHVKSHLRSIRKHTGKEPMGYEALANATNMLNEMINTATQLKDVKGTKCADSERNSLAQLGDLKQAIEGSNAAVSKARSEVLAAQDRIASLEDTELPRAQDTLQRHTTQCNEELAILTMQRNVCLSDMEVMDKILGMMECSSTGSADMGSALFLQGPKSSALVEKGESLSQCVACTAPDGNRFVSMRNTKADQQLRRLSSPAARAAVRDNLLDDFYHPLGRSRKHESFLQSDPGFSMEGLPEGWDDEFSGTCDESMTGVNGSGYRGCQYETITGRNCQEWDRPEIHNHSLMSEENVSLEYGLGSHDYCRNPNGNQTIWCYTTDPAVPWEYCSPLAPQFEPEGTSKFVCKPTGACKLGAGQCEKLWDRFMKIDAGIRDTEQGLFGQHEERSKECNRLKTEYDNAITAKEGELLQQQTNLATGTTNLVQNQQQASLSGQQHKETQDQYMVDAKRCCDERNTLSSEMCALAKIRGELHKMEGRVEQFADCELSDWSDDECSAPCAGGTQERSRTIIERPHNGSACLPLRMERDCNLQKCPIDCKMDVWAGWSKCSAECGGGTQTRNRPVTVKAQYDGEPCGEEQETRTCQTQNCDADCILYDWSSWGQCTKACLGGHKERKREIKADAEGSGKQCDELEEARLEKGPCNDFDCTEFLRDNRTRTTVRCNAMIDLVILLDGSGSLGENGWGHSKQFAERLVSSLDLGENTVELALLVFSGPRTKEGFHRCISNNPNETPDLERDCGIDWIDHFTTNEEKVEADIEALEFPQSTTFTSMAMVEAKNELINGRPDAQSVVVIITDGKPLFNRATGAQAEEIKKSARLIWVPVGQAVSTKTIMKKLESWASDPWEDNVVAIPDFEEMAVPTYTNSLLGSMCPVVY